MRKMRRTKKCLRFTVSKKEWDAARRRRKKAGMVSVLDLPTFGKPIFPNLSISREYRCKNRLRMPVTLPEYTYNGDE
jgi:hypothetical protein